MNILEKQVAHGVATPALLCHKEPAHGTQSPLLGALGRNAPYYEPLILLQSEIYIWIF